VLRAVCHLVCPREWRLGIDGFISHFRRLEAAPVSIITKGGVGHVAIGNDAEDTYRSRGTVRVYRYIQEGEMWTQVGTSTREGTFEREVFGESLSP
jgi:hypothetical protein